MSNDAPKKSTPTWQLGLLVVLVIIGGFAYARMNAMNKEFESAQEEGKRLTEKMSEVRASENQDRLWEAREKFGITTKECEHCKTEIPLRATRCPNCTGELTR